MISNARVITTLCVKLFKDKRVIVEYISLNYMKFFLDLWNSSGEEATYSQRISILKKFIKELGHNKSIDEMIIVVEKMAKRMGLNKYERTKQKPTNLKIIVFFKTIFNIILMIISHFT